MNEEPSRHRADDDLEALTSGSFAPDLGGGSNKEGGGTAMIDDDDDTEAALNNLINSAVASATQFTIDDTSNGDSASDGASTDGDEGDGIDEEALYAEDRQEFKLAEKTSQIMEDYRAYLSEMGGEKDGENNDITSTATTTTDTTTNGGGIANNPVELKLTGDEYTTTFHSPYDDENEDVPSLSMMGGPKASLARDFTYREELERYRDGYSDMDGTNNNLNTVHFRNPDYEDLRAELGLGGRRGYKYPAFRSKRFKRCALTVVVATVVIGSIVGIVSGVKKSRKEKNLPDWESELAKVMEEEQEKKHSGGSFGGGGGSSVAAGPSEGGGGGGGGGTNNEGILGGISGMTPQVSDGLQLPPSVPDDMEIINPPPAVLEPSPPSIWFNWAGGNQQDGIEFCEKNYDGVGDHMVLCPTSPLNETHIQCCVKISSDLDATVPPATTTSTEAATTTASTITTTTTTEATVAAVVTPAVTIEISEDTTTTKATTTTTTGPSLTNQQISLLYEIASLSYQPNFIDRNEGWSGKTFMEAIEYCMDFDRVICPYEAVCPLGEGHTPMGGYRDDSPEGSWVPIFNRANAWVNIGSQDACVDYKDWKNNPSGLDGPSWGESNGVESLTRRVICCLPEKADINNFDFDTGTFKNPEDNPTKTTTTSTSTSSTTTTTANISNEDKAKAYQYAAETFLPNWYERSDGWEGKTYAEALQFCAKQDSSIPCPYAAVCPMGVYGIPSGGFRNEESEAWIPIIDGPNQWVEVSQINPCVKYTASHPTPPEWGLTGEGSEELTRHIMCCQEPGYGKPGAELVGNGAPAMSDGSSTATAGNSTAAADGGGDDGISPTETTSGGGSLAPETQTGYVAPPANERTEDEQTILDKFHPVWLGRDEGYQGRSWYEANDFCRNVGKFILCPMEAYCPNGPTTERRPLFLDAAAFPNEQWAPVGGADENTWLMIGTVDGNPASTCLTHTEIFGGPPTWGTDGTYTEMKQNILCCVSKEEESVELTAEEKVEQEMRPVWFDEEFGWEGGTHEDAMNFCKGIGSRELCPYTAYCPHGESQPVFGKHTVDFNMEGEQWAPFLFGEDSTNHWVMIGKKNDNGATTCMTHEQLEGGKPIWGTTGDWPEIKRHIMCCDMSKE